MAKRRRKRYSFKPRFYIIISIFILMVFGIAKLAVNLMSNIDAAYASNIVKGSNNILIAIDSGHDAKTDKGAAAPGGVYEYKLNDSISAFLQQELIDRGYSVIQTRPLNSSVEKTLNERVLKINEVWPNLLVSIHHNTNEDVAAKGFTILYNRQKTDAYDGNYVKYKNKIYKLTKQDDNYIYYKSGSREKRFDKSKNEGNYTIFELSSSNLVQESKNAADKIYKSMKTLEFISPLSDNKENVIINQNLQLLRQTHCAGLLIECGFMTNEAELAEIINESNQKKMAKAIADGIDEYFGIKSDKENN